MRFARSTALLCALAIAAAAGAAAARGAGGPSAGSTTSQATFGHRFQYFADPTGRSTRVTRMNSRATRVFARRMIGGNWGIPQIADDGTAGGLSHDRRTLVLASGSASPSRFAVFDARTLRMRQVVTFQGSFSFDALSPNGRTLYLIQHVGSCCSNRYYVRAYDLRLHRLLKKVIFDIREKWGLMSGSPVTRATSRSGRWVYTLYTRPGGKPFVHALDSSHRRAVCVDLPWIGSQNPLFRMRLALQGRKLRLRRPGGRVVRTIDTKTFAVT